GFANVCLPTATLYVPAGTLEKSKVPLSSAFDDWTTLPVEFRSWTVAPGSPTSCDSMTPGLPPPGLKSRQTVPTTSPCFGAGFTACFAPFGVALGAIPVSPSSATPPGCTGVLSTRLPPEDTSVGVDGSALGRIPGEETMPLTDFPSALMAPWCGSCWYMIRHVTPVANAEIAIGRKTTVLNATDQRTRSVRTAKISPKAVTNAGTTATQMALFLIAVVRVDVVNSSL